MRDGATASLRVPIGPFGLVRVRWDAVHEDVRAGAQFVDRMTRGPFHSWRHLHRFTSADDRPQPASRLEDALTYELPFPPVGRLGNGLVASMLHQTFDWRHRRTGNDLRRHYELAGLPLTIAVTGASGLVGSALCAFLSTGGHCVRRIVRGAASADRGDIRWDPSAGTIDAAALEGVDAVVHLAGESIAARWNPERKERIRASRVRGTHLLATAMARCARKPNVFVSASAVGFYGDRKTEKLVESSARGSGFLADVCEAWESAAQPARDAGIRTVHPRIGMVLAGNGGALRALVTPFSFGLGGPVGSGRQGMPWIAIDDLIASVLFTLRTPTIEGPYNAVAPGLCDNRTFSRALGRALRRPAIVPLPAFAVRAALGEMGQELLLGGAMVTPRVLSDHGFRFDFPDLDGAFRFELGRLQG